MSMKSEDEEASGRYLERSRWGRDPREARGALVSTLLSIFLSIVVLALVSALLVWPLWYLATARKGLFAAGLVVLLLGLCVFVALSRFRRARERKRAGRRP
jgi:hypothetical protein